LEEGLKMYAKNMFMKIRHLKFTKQVDSGAKFVVQKKEKIPMK